MEQPGNFISWPHRIGALLAAMAGSGVASRGIVFLGSALVGDDGDLRIIPIALVILAFVLVPAVVPVFVTGMVLLRQGWLKLWHFMIAGGLCGAFYWILINIVSWSSGAMPDASALMEMLKSTSSVSLIALCSGSVGAACAWGYLRGARQIRPVAAP